MIHSPTLLQKEIKTLEVSSPAFDNNSFIPEKYTCDGENINPPIDINKLPEETRSLVLIVEDKDAPIRSWIHWLVWNIPVTSKIKEKCIPGKEGINDFRQQHYGGPCPPSGTHRYLFKVYALDDLLYLNLPITKLELEKAMSSHIIGFGELEGLYRKQRRF
jgi:hypothetical protein